jgi:hypothetical protein
MRPEIPQRMSVAVEERFCFNVNLATGAQELWVDIWGGGGGVEVGGEDAVGG